MKINGAEINNLKELVRQVESTKGPYLRIDLEYNQVGRLPSHEPSPRCWARLLGAVCLGCSCGTLLLGLGAL